jgi:hypothetical protein
MSRTALRVLHAATSTLGLLFITGFLIATILAEIGGDPGAIVRVKTGILYAVLALVPIMAVAGASGQRLASSSRAMVIQRKLRRMRLVGINAVAVLIPCVVVLYWLANQGRFGGLFAAVQTVELVAGGVNIALLGLNLRDGLGMRTARSAGRQRRHAERIRVPPPARGPAR